MVKYRLMTENDTASVLEANQRLSQSHLWQIQRQFFDRQGIQAWNTGKVPHYVTSNPFIARAYSNVVLGFLRDCLTHHTLDTNQPVYIVELGTGSGRFAYHFLKHFVASLPQTSLGHIAIKYVMTDLAQTNVAFWQAQPMLQPYIQQGVLDFAQFDFPSDSHLHLVRSRQALSAETLKNPPILLANYFLDCIPQDLFALKDGQLHETLVSLSLPDNSEVKLQNSNSDTIPPDLLEALQLDFSERPITSNYYNNPAYDQVLHYYQQHLDNTSLLFPITALEGLTRLREWAGDRLLFLTADKGYSREADLRDRPRPKLVFHQGSFSLSVNYHAIAHYTQTQGGQALVPTHQPQSLQVCAFFFGLCPQDSEETNLAYQQFVENAGPDDFFSLKKSLEPHYPSLTLPQILSYLRFSGWDSNIFLGCFPFLMIQIPSAPIHLYSEIREVIHHLWDTYYWIGEDTDLPFRLSLVLAEMGDYGEAIVYAEHSRQLYGDTPVVLLHQAICHLHLGRTAEATTLLDPISPQMEAAQVLQSAIPTDPDTLAPLLDLLQIQIGNPDLLHHPISLNPLSISFQSLRHFLESYSEGTPLGSTAGLLRTEPSTLVKLGNKFQLSPFERMILLLCLGLELEPNFQLLCAKAQRDNQKPYATLGLALSAFPDADWSVLSPQSPLHDWQLIHLEPERILTEAPLKLDRRILCYLLDEPALDPQLADLVMSVTLDGLSDTLPQSHQRIVEQLISTWSTVTTTHPLPLIALIGSDITVSRTVAAAACDRLGFQLMTLSVASLPNDLHELKKFQRYWEREAILSNSVLLLDGNRTISSEPSHQVAIAMLLETLTTPVIFSSRDPRSQLHRSAVILDIPPLPHHEQTALWQTHLGDSAADLDGHIHVLASQFKLTSTTIQTISRQFQLQNSSLEKKAANSEIQNSLWNLCRLQARPNLDDLAQRIEATATWEDLILPSRQRQILEDIVIHLRYRAQVYQTWGFAQKGNRGLGISALFHGESGTGKTMAAEVLSQECHLDLYRIDLSTVVSKYIGETEKNLRRIFDAAEAGGVILLFDEADALFGKRTEVKDSHDRHANIEVSYLLQRMETYQGLAILTSNLKNNLDEAFLRRLRFIVPFSFPDANARAEIWQRIFPAQTPIEGLDYNKLSQLKLAGGNIRNIALNAAFLAACANQAVTMNHIRQAAQRDYLKLEKLLTTEELKGWAISDL